MLALLLSLKSSKTDQRSQRYCEQKNSSRQGCDANHRASSLCGATQSTKASGEKSTFTVTPIDTASLPRRTDGTKGSNTGSPNEASYQHDQAAQTLGSAITTVDVESQLDGETTARLPGQERVSQDPEDLPSTVSPSCFVPTSRKQEVGVEREPQRAEVTGTTVLSRATTQVRPDVLLENATPVREPSSRATKGGTLFDAPLAPLKTEERPSKAVGDAKATTTKKIAIGQEAASAQAVNRGHSVTCIEVPDEDDDTAYQTWLAKERLPTETKKGDEPSSVPPTKTNMKWFKPFEVDWTLRAVCEARNDNATRAALFVWTHVDRVPELTTELLSEIKKGGELARERLYELCKPPRYL
ncbi:uncharacterized protein ARMOST_21905 [Armillaria ostoyae]|uniref:Uncharacterized protein n=1 Tax=Armillaria ostoyae TaxID=47428 RepID=A0A284SBH8_ARMOS|nr:uncharacterized protein ARMOST_21905 [Armillaria ostoyae]